MPVTSTGDRHPEGLMLRYLLCLRKYGAPKGFSLTSAASYAKGTTSYGTSMLAYNL